MRRSLKGLATFTITGILVGLSAFSARAAGTALTLSAHIGTPTASVQVKGSGFLDFEAVDVYFDGTDLALASASATGAFSVRITVPSTAQPGTHYVTAVGRADQLSAQSVFTVQSNWPQFHFDPTLTGFNPYENTLNPSNVFGLDEDWSFTTGTEIESSPVVVKGVVYIGSDDGNVYALNATTGALKWSVDIGSSVKGAPAVANSVVYVGSDNGHVYALKASTGASVWDDDLSFLEPGGFTAPPTVTGGVVYIEGASGIVYALDASDGFDLWAVLPESSCASALAVAVRKGTVYANQYCGGEALNASNGGFLFSYFGSSSPTIGQNLIFDGGLGIYRASAERTGGERWQADYFGDDENFSGAALANNVLYAGATDDSLYAINAASGTADWSFQTGGIVASSPAVADGVVYAGSVDGNIYALNASSGELLWTGTTGGAIVSSPAVVNGEVYVGSEDGTLYAFGLNTSGTRVSRPNPSSLRPDMRLKRTT